MTSTNARDNYESEHVVNGERQRGRVLRDVTVALFLEFASGIYNIIINGTYSCSFVPTIKSERLRLRRSPLAAVPPPPCARAAGGSRVLSVGLAGSRAPEPARRATPKSGNWAKPQPSTVFPLALQPVPMHHSRLPSVTFPFRATPLGDLLPIRAISSTRAPLTSTRAPRRGSQHSSAPLRPSPHRCATQYVGA